MICLCDAMRECRSMSPRRSFIFAFTFSRLFGFGRLSWVLFAVIPLDMITKRQNVQKVPFLWSRGSRWSSYSTSLVDHVFGSRHLHGHINPTGIHLSDGAGALQHILDLDCKGQGDLRKDDRSSNEMVAGCCWRLKRYQGVQRIFFANRSFGNAQTNPNTYELGDEPTWSFGICPNQSLLLGNHISAMAFGILQRTWSSYLSQALDLWVSIEQPIPRRDSSSSPVTSRGIPPNLLAVLRRSASVSRQKTLQQGGVKVGKAEHEEFTDQMRHFGI